ncbi:MAG: twin-arginine translocase TatA/TatE family subunit [Myxococcota bacterium]|nr:twin-arginine translocase TatA/TatE family subunit [Myxococcota bacterium]
MVGTIPIFGMPGAQELIILLVIVLILFGPGKLPGIGEALGKGIRSFKDNMKDVEADMAVGEIDVTPASDEAEVSPE